METKTARLTLLIDPEKKRAFERLCALQDLTPSQVVRQLIREYLASVLPGLADRPVQRVAELTPAAWAALFTLNGPRTLFSIDTTAAGP